MAALRSLRKLLFGETVSLPVGLACALGAAVAIKAALPSETWTDLGGPIVFGLVLGVLAVSLRLS
jgi:hypothetical protein